LNWRPQCGAKGDVRMIKLTTGDLGTRSTLGVSIKRHKTFLWKHAGLRRLSNAALCVAEMKAGLSRLRSHPVYLRVNISPFCNLRCAGCSLAHSGDGKTDASRPRRMMSVEQFKSAVGELVPYAIGVNLYDEGEPLLNKGIYEIAEFLARNNVGSCASSNFSLELSDDDLDKLSDCGLEHLIVAIDGVCQETYGRYRVGGHLDLVLDNVRRLRDIQNSRGRKLPHIEFQFIQFGWNADEAAKVMEMAGELGVWRFTVVQGSSHLGWEGMRFKGAAAERRKRGCYQIWVCANINSDGEMYPCDYGEDHGMAPLGSAADYQRLGMRNHPDLVRLRQSFRARSGGLHEICAHCSLYAKGSSSPPVRNRLNTL